MTQGEVRRLRRCPDRHRSRVGLRRGLEVALVLVDTAEEEVSEVASVSDDASGHNGLERGTRFRPVPELPSYSTEPYAGIIAARGSGYG
jgi:hypothetical protein